MSLNFVLKLNVRTLQEISTLGVWGQPLSQGQEEWEYVFNIVINKKKVIIGTFLGSSG